MICNKTARKDNIPLCPWWWNAAKAILLFIALLLGHHSDDGLSLRADVVSSPATYRGLPSLSPTLSQIFHLPRWTDFSHFGVKTKFLAGQRHYRLWFRGLGNWGSVGSSGQNSDLKYNSYGFSLGVDQQIGQNLLFGAGLGGTWMSAQGKTQRRTSLDTDMSTLHGIIYARTTWNRIYVDLEGGFGENEQSRTVRQNSPFTGIQWHVNAETGTWMGKGLAKMEPYFGLRHTSLETESDTETKTTLSGGLRYSWKTAGTYGSISPRLYGGVLQEVGGTNLMNAGVLTDTPAVFTFPGYKIPDTRFFFGGGFTSTMGRSLDLYFRYSAEVASDFSIHAILVGMNWNF